MIQTPPILKKLLRRPLNDFYSDYHELFVGLFRPRVLFVVTHQRYIFIPENFLYEQTKNPKIRRWKRGMHVRNREATIVDVPNKSTIEPFAAATANKFFRLHFTGDPLLTEHVSNNSLGWRGPYTTALPMTEVFPFHDGLHTSARELAPSSSRHDELTMD